MVVLVARRRLRDAGDESGRGRCADRVFPARPPRLPKNQASRFVFILAMSVLAWVVLGLRARAQSPSEYQVKAVFLYNFAKFIEWPPEAPPEAHDPIIIGIVGKDPFGVLLEQIVNGKTVDRRSLAVKRFKRGDDLRGCHILFISSSEKEHLRAILDSLKGASVLTVGETEGFARRGGVINFVLEDNKVHFEINVDAAARARVKISSKLLSLARVLRDEAHGGKS